MSHLIRNSSRALVAVLIGFTIGGCVVYLNDAPSVDEFVGLRTHLDRRLVRVLVVHGMGTTTPGFSCYLREGLQRELGLKRLDAQSADHDCDRVASAENWEVPGGCHELKRSSLSAMTVQGTTVPAAAVHSCDYAFALDASDMGSGLLRFYELTWSPLTTQLKRNFLHQDRPEGGYRWPRLRINESLKLGLVDDKLSDPAAYIGQMKPTIQQAVREVLRAVAADCPKGMAPDTCRGAEAQRVAIIAYSLGSDLVFDVAAHPSSEGPSTSDVHLLSSLTAPTGLIYLLANQIPLISLGEAAHPSEKPQGSLARFLTAASRQRALEGVKTAEATSVVAFSDPNDLLSYRLTAEFIPKEPPVQFANVILNISRWAIYIPFFGWVTNPLTAHTGHDRDARVIRLISCGAGKRAAC